MLEAPDREYRLSESTTPALEALSGVAFFRDLGRETLIRLAMLTGRRVFQPGEVLMRQGDHDDWLYVIQRGRVWVEVEDPRLRAPVRLAELGAGEVVGEMGLLDGAPRSATVTAVEETETLRLQHVAVATAILPDARAMGHLARLLGERLRATNRQIARLLQPAAD